ncbi:MAG: hypothetical protein MUC63_06375 [Planctomycetes bacterium]|jgi:hypothetical protein|nr:hypothetical protein [Planctomycetota bacterium]
MPQAETGPRQEDARARGLAGHRAFYASSAARTLAFYGTVLAMCLAVPILVALGISFFFLRFYRREIAGFLRHPLRGSNPRFPPEFEGYSFQVLPPGSFPTGRPGADPKAPA